MLKENYMVVQLPKENETGDVTIGEPAWFNDFDAAFDCFNEMAAAEGLQLVQPKYTKPLRAALNYYNIELWVIKRTDELVKNYNHDSRNTTMYKGL